MFKVRIATLAVLLLLVVMSGCRSAHTTSAILYLDEEAYDKAVAVLHEGLEYNPNEPDAYFWLGKAHGYLAEEAVDANDFTEAFKHFSLTYEYLEKAEELDPEHLSQKVIDEQNVNFTNQNVRAKQELEQGYYEQCEGFFRLAYAALPDSTSPIKNIARMKMRQSAEMNPGEEQQALLNEALELLDQVLESQPEQFGLLADKANVLASLDRPAEANAIFDELMREHGDDDMLLADIANLAVSQQELERAADLMVRIVDLREVDDNVNNDEENKGMLVNAATWYATDKVDRYPEAIDLLDRAGAMEAIPEEDTMFRRLQTYFNYGTKLKGQALGETDTVVKADLDAQAKEMFERGVQVGNALVSQYMDSKYGFFYLAQCQFELGDATAAEENIKSFNDLDAMGGTPE